MKAPSFQKTAAVSTVLHLAVVLLAVLISRQSGHIPLPSPYVVSLVGPGEDMQGSGKEDAAEDSSAQKPLPATSLVEDIKTVKTNVSKKDEKRAEDRIAELAAKKKISDLAALKKRLLDIKGGLGSHVARKTAGAKGMGKSGGAAGTGSYEGRITSEIRRQWAWPDTAEKDIYAVIAVKILKDGTIVVHGFEKRSGNRLFDSIALKTLAKASPVTPPPYEMEIGLNFYP